MGPSYTLHRGERTPLLQHEINSGSTSARKVIFYRTIYNPFTFVVLFTISSLAIMAATGYLSSVLSTIEQRFQLKSTETSLLFTIEDAVGFSTVLFITHFGNSANKPKIISCLFFVVAIGSVLQTVPHFLFQPPASLQPSQDGRDSEGEGGGGEGGGGSEEGDGHLKKHLLCENTSFVMDNCTSTETMNSGALWYQVWYIYLGQAFAGFGISTHPLAVTYLDDSPARNFLPIFVAIIYGFRATGLSIGELIAQQCLSIPASWPLVTSDVVTDPKDPHYVGAWWLGFIPIAVMAFSPALLLFFFPKVIHASDSQTIPDDKGSTESENNILRENDRETRGSGQVTRSSDSGGSTIIAGEELKSILGDILNAITDFFRALFRVMRNWIVLSLMFADHALSFSSYPDGTYAAKYLQYEFHLSAAEASALKAWTKLPSVFVGYFLGAFILMTGRLKRRGTIIMAALCIVCTALLTPAKLFAGCENNPIAGLTVPYADTNIQDKNIWSTADRNLTAMCNANLHLPSGYNPVCAPSGVSYVTACHAGCTEKLVKMEGSKNVTVYTHCSCNDELFLNLKGEEDKLSDGLCATDCTWVYHFILLMLTSLLRHITYSPSLISKVRFVHEQDRSMIQGLDKFIKSFFVTSPAPVIYGILFDKSCMLFQSSCGKTGNCLVFDIKRLRMLLFGVASASAIISSAAAFLTIILVICRAKRVRTELDGNTDISPQNTSPSPSQSLPFETDSPNQIAIVQC